MSRLTETTMPPSASANAGPAKKGGFKVGDRIGVLTNDPAKSFTVAGVFGYSGERDSIGGEQTVAFTVPVAQQLMLGKAGAFSGISVDTGSGTAAVKSALAKELGAGFEVVTGKELAKKASDKSRGILDLMNQMKDQGVTQLSLPWSQILAYLIGAAVVGVVASIAPARRGARLNVLRAISHA
ncbi:hypothetical protein ACIQRW_15280 [Streptomyces sp. NPDC091287]|uniref:hypothetical protein n=1 Tax=Streptomyces sp. NPDC091287 TaxID=3365988 RepID=UPI0038198E0C